MTTKEFFQIPLSEKIFLYVSFFLLGVLMIHFVGALMIDYYDTISEHIAYEARFGHPLPWVDSINGTDF